MCFVRLRLNECLSLCLYGVAFSNVNNFDVWDVRTYGCYLSASSIVDTVMRAEREKFGTSEKFVDFTKSDNHFFLRLRYKSLHSF